MAPGASAVNLRAALAVLIMCASAAPADVIYFKNGSQREVKKVLYVRDGTLYFETRDGKNTIGIPMSVVMRWERTDVDDEDEKEADSQTPPAKTPAKTPPEEPAAETKDDSQDGVAASGRTYRLEDLAALEKALSGNPGNPALRRSLAFAHSQIAVEAHLMSSDAPYQFHMGRAVSLTPDDNMLTRLDAVREHHKNGRLDQARHALRQASPSARIEDYRLLLLDGRLAYETGDLAQALESWEQAAKMNPGFGELQNALAAVRREIGTQSEFGAEESSHFVFEYDHAVDAYLAGEITSMLEDAYARITAELDHRPEQPIRVLVYAQADFQAVTGIPADYVEGLFDGKIRLPLRAALRQRDTLRDTLAHETAHAVIHYKTRGHAGRWLHEGLAQVFEEGKNPYRYAASYLKSYERAGGAPMPSDYPSSHLWVVYLREEYGHARVLDLLDALAANPDEEAAYREAFGMGRRELAERWLDHLRQATALRSPFEDANPFTR
jgi:tetratricopeptide (TPR) repeat protein